jgi:hypothetical protein
MSPGSCPGQWCKSGGGIAYLRAVGFQDHAKTITVTVHFIDTRDELGQRELSGLSP